MKFSFRSLILCLCIPITYSNTCIGFRLSGSHVDGGEYPAEEAHPSDRSSCLGRPLLIEGGLSSPFLLHIHRRSCSRCVSSFRDPSQLTGTSGCTELLVRAAVHTKIETSADQSPPLILNHSPTPPTPPTPYPAPPGRDSWPRTLI